MMCLYKKVLENEFKVKEFNLQERANRQPGLKADWFVAGHHQVTHHNIQ